MDLKEIKENLYRWKGSVGIKQKADRENTRISTLEKKMENIDTMVEKVKWENDEKREKWSRKDKEKRKKGE